MSLMSTDVHAIKLFEHNTVSKLLYFIISSNIKHFSFNFYVCLTQPPHPFLSPTWLDRLNVFCGSIWSSSFLMYPIYYFIVLSLNRLGQWTRPLNWISIFNDLITRNRANVSLFPAYLVNWNVLPVDRMPFLPFVNCACKVNQSNTSKIFLWQITWQKYCLNWRILLFI